MEDVNAAELISEALAQSISSPSFKKTRVGYEPNDAAVADAVACPANRTDIAVVETSGQSCLRTCCVCVVDSSVQLRICDILIVVVLTTLPNRIRRVSHDDTDVEGLLAFAAVAVVGEEIADEVTFFVELESISETDALEGFVFPADESVIDSLDVDGGDIVGEQDDFVGVDLVFVFVRELLLADEAALKQAGDEGAGAGEGIDDVDSLAAEGLAELALQEVIDGVPVPQKVRRATKPTYGSKQRRLAGKSQRSEIKSSRGKVSE